MNETENNAKTFTEYRPEKLKYGKDHPDAIIESATLASVSPADISYKISIPENVVDNGLLSAVQLENIVYACQAHNKELPNGERVGFFIGDGAGVGKGRSIAGIIYENSLNNRKRSVWISCSASLKYDAERDLKDIHADITVREMKKVSTSL